MQTPCGHIVGQRIKLKQLFKDRTPGVIGCRLVDSVTGTDKFIDAHTLRLPQQIFHQARFSKPGLTLDDDDTTPHIAA